MKSICNEIRRGLEDLFVCDLVGDFVRVRTPFLYPDGDYIDLFVSLENVGCTISDLGESLRWLRDQSPGTRRELTAKQRDIINDICQTLGITYTRGVFSVEIRNGNTSEAVLSLAQAITRVCDISYTQRTRTHTNAIPFVANILDRYDVAYRRDVLKKGLSGTDWKVNFEVEADRQQSLVFVLSSTSRSQARQLAEHTVAAWTDLRRAVSDQTVFVSLLDDRSEELWEKGHLNLVKSVSEVALLSQPTQFVEIIGAAA